MTRWCDSNIVMSLVEERNAKGGRVGDVSCAARTPGVVPAIGVGPPKGGENNLTRAAPQTVSMLAQRLGRWKENYLEKVHAPLFLVAQAWCI